MHPGCSCAGLSDVLQVSCSLYAVAVADSAALQPLQGCVTKGKTSVSQRTWFKKHVKSVKYRHLMAASTLSRTLN